eukprot:4932351-Pleurochrysis_carterae.AAC.9
MTMRVVHVHVQRRRNTQTRIVHEPLPCRMHACHQRRNARRTDRIVDLGEEVEGVVEADLGGPVGGQREAERPAHVEALALDEHVAGVGERQRLDHGALEQHVRLVEGAAAG